MKVKVPKQIKIGAHTYSVCYKQFLGKDMGFRGTIEHRLQEIWIDPDNPESQKAETLIHEVLHLIGSVFSTGLDDSNVDRIAEGFLELLANNLGIEFDWSDIK